MFLCIVLCAALLLGLVARVALRHHDGRVDGRSATTGMMTADALASPLLRSWLSSSSGNSGRGGGGWFRRPSEPVVIGYAVSLIKCGDFQSSRAGLVDAALVLQHSVHLTSARTPASGSVYDYRMFAIVHAQAEPCAGALRDAGYAVLVRDPPIARREIQGGYLRSHVQRAWCCGDDEFVKLYAYTLPEVPIVVHVDMDFVFHRPMDDVYDAMLFSKDSAIGKQARERIPVEFPNELTWPDNIEAMMTRDWPQVMPGRKPPFQAGFLVAKPNQEVFDVIVDVIRMGDYVEGYSRENGWGGSGHGGYVGAMAYVAMGCAFVASALRKSG